MVNYERIEDEFKELAKIVKNMFTKKPSERPSISDIIHNEKEFSEYVSKYLFRNGMFYHQVEGKLNF